MAITMPPNSEDTRLYLAATVLHYQQQALATRIVDATKRIARLTASLDRTVDAFDRTMIEIEIVRKEAERTLDETMLASIS